MKKGIRQILCIMTVVISLLTTSALALSADYTLYYEESYGIQTR